MTKQQLAEKIRQKAYLEGEFILRSGRKSNYYLDKYLFETDPEILEELARRMADFADDVDVIAGAELGAVALATAVSLITKKPFCIVRKERKDYATGKLIEGADVSGKKVLLVEDVGTTAGAALSAARVLTDAGADIRRIVFAIDRMEGARENVESAGFEFHAILTIEDLGLGTQGVNSKVD